MKVLPWSALAMCIDCEGNISIGKHQKSVNGDCYQTDINVTNTNRILMDWLISNFGGRYYTRPARNEFHKQSMIWRMTGRKNKENLLLGVLPYLLLKREQALLVLEFVRMKEHERDPERRRRLAMACQQLNAKGPAQTTNTLEVSTPVETKIESELHGDMQSAPAVTPGSE